MRWVQLPTEEDKVAALHSALKVHPVICRMLVQRGIETYEDAKAFFRPELDKLHDPFLMRDMDKAINRITTAIERNERILIYGDYDVDGTTSVACMYQFLVEIHNKSLLDFYIPHRYREGYGISKQGIDFAKENNFIAPQNSFNDSLLLKVGDKTILAKSFGEGHTKDNVVGYFPSEELLFGGCLIKELDATKGYLGDANVAVWSTTVENIKKRFPNLTLVVPGHGKYGNAELLDYTIDLFKTKHFGEDKFESK